MKSSFDHIVDQLPYDLLATPARVQAAFDQLGLHTRHLMLLSQALQGFSWYPALPERERQVIEIRWARGWTLAATAEEMTRLRETPITRERVRQLEGKAIQGIATELGWSKDEYEAAQRAAWQNRLDTVGER